MAATGAVNRKDPAAKRAGASTSWRRRLFGIFATMFATDILIALRDKCLTRLTSSATRTAYAIQATATAVPTGWHLPRGKRHHVGGMLEPMRRLGAFEGGPIEWAPQGCAGHHPGGTTGIHVVD